MLLTILGILFVLVLICIFRDEDDLGFGMGFLFGLFLIIVLLVAIPVVKARTLDEKITMYQEENAVIEAQIETLVTNYMQYEQTTFEKCNTESMITLIDLYPELKSDTLVSKQIDVYLANNEKIKELKESKINVSVYKWWLYFGK